MTIDIKDLADGKELDGKAMEVVRGGFCGYVVFAAPAASSKPQFAALPLSSLTSM